MNWRLGLPGRPAQCRRRRRDTLVPQDGWTSFVANDTFRLIIHTSLSFSSAMSAEWFQSIHGLFLISVGTKGPDVPDVSSADRAATSKHIQTNSSRPLKLKNTQIDFNLGDRAILFQIISFAFFTTVLFDPSDPRPKVPPGLSGDTRGREQSSVWESICCFVALKVLQKKKKSSCSATLWHSVCRDSAGDYRIILSWDQKTF